MSIILALVVIVLGWPLLYQNAVMWVKAPEITEKAEFGCCILFILFGFYCLGYFTGRKW